MASSACILGFVDSLFADQVVTEVLTSFAATYGLHSTLLLAVTWMLVRIGKRDSHFFQERIWKLAATAGLVTATVQLATGLGLYLTSATRNRSRSKSSVQHPNRLASRVNGWRRLSK